MKKCAWQGVAVALLAAVLVGCGQQSQSLDQIEVHIDGNPVAMPVCRLRIGAFLTVIANKSTVEVDTRAPESNSSSTAISTDEGTLHANATISLNQRKVASGTLEVSESGAYVMGVFAIGDVEMGTTKSELLLGTQRPPMLVRESDTSLLIIDVRGDSGGGTVVHRVVKRGDELIAGRLTGFTLWAESVATVNEQILIMGTTGVKGESVGWAMAIGDDDRAVPMECRNTF